MMLHILKTSLLLIGLFLVTSCSNDFLTENQSPGSYTMGLSNMYISPDWESADYVFILPLVTDVKYEIVSKPTWLTVNSIKGQLTDSTAIVRCSATKHPDFEKVGVYLDYMTVKADGEKFKVPVGYITEGNPVLQVDEEQSLWTSNFTRTDFRIRNNGNGVLMWNITRLPDWLALDTDRLAPDDFFIGSYKTFDVPLRIRYENVHTGILTGAVGISTNDKNHPSKTITLSVDLGTPSLYIGVNSVVFMSSETSKSVSFSNSERGLLPWEFKDIPDWLTISPSSGILGSYTSTSVTFRCNQSKLSPGKNTATIHLKTNDSNNPSQAINVTAYAPGGAASIRAVNGNIVDALFNKNTNTLYYVTSSPSMFVAYDVIEKKVLNEIALSKTPTCFAISEDWTTSAVGHNGFMSVINLTSNTVTTVYPLDHSVNDIAWAENDWFSYTIKAESFSALYWINTANGTIYHDSDNYSLDGNTLIKKVPNQPYLIATRNYTSPSGFFAYDIATKKKKSYAHMDLTNFWFSENGDYIFDRNYKVYRTTSSTGLTDVFNATINPIGKIDINTLYANYYGITFVYHSGKNLWVLHDEASAGIYQVEDNDYTVVNNYGYDNYYQPSAQTSAFRIIGKYVFVNKEETEMALLCRGVENNTWIIQFIAVN